jgi:biopolymer transport protein ExbD
MSHGGGDDSAESDLTPLLDLVLQMLMFFIVNVNMAMEQANPDVKLPDSTSATPVSKPIAGDVYLNQRIRSDEVMSRLTPTDKERLQNAESIIFISGEEPMTVLGAKGWLSQQHEKLGKEAADKVTIHFRPEGELEVTELLKLMHAVKNAGFTKVSMHAMVKSGE